MDNREAILDALKDFGKKPSPDIPPLLEDYLRIVAKNGETVFPWTVMKPLLLEKIRSEMLRFHEDLPGDDAINVPNVENIKFNDLKERIIRRLNAFNGAPFTVQRLCELLTEPKKHYRRSDKFLRGIERNVNVVSTVDPFGRKIVSESKHLMNGLMDHSIQDTPKAKRLPPPPPCTPITHHPEPPPSAFNSPVVATPDTMMENSVDAIDKTLSAENSVEPAVKLTPSVEIPTNVAATSLHHGTIGSTESGYTTSVISANHAVYMDLPPVDRNTEASLVTTDSPTMALSPSACYTNLETMERVSVDAAPTQPANIQLYPAGPDRSALPSSAATQFPAEFRTNLSAYPALDGSTQATDTTACDIKPTNVNSDLLDQPLQFKVTAPSFIDKLGSADRDSGSGRENHEPSSEGDTLGSAAGERGVTGEAADVSEGAAQGVVSEAQAAPVEVTDSSDDTSSVTDLPQQSTDSRLVDEPDVDMSTEQASPIDDVPSAIAVTTSTHEPMDEN